MNLADPRGCLALILGLSITHVACAHIPSSRRAEFRKSEYFRTHPELPPAIERAILDGHIIAGMDREQVKVVLGDPVRVSRFQARSDIEVWLYQGYKFHQDQIHTISVLYRIVCVAGRVVLVEPI